MSRYLHRDRRSVESGPRVPLMKPTISIALLALGLMFPAPVAADDTRFRLAPLPTLPELKAPTEYPQTGSGSDGNELLQIRPTRSGRSAVTPERQNVINRLNANRRQEASRWRNFGGIQYDWKSWKLTSGDTRVTTMRFSSSTDRTYQVAVTCKGLKVSHKDKGVWSNWKMPNSGEEQMLIELCSQIPGAPKAVVRPEATERYKPTDCNGSRIACAIQL